MANNTWNSWVSYIQDGGTWNMYNGFKPEQINNKTPVDYKHKSVIGSPNRVLHFEILQCTVKITTHVLYSVLIIHGEILRIAIYKKFRQLRAFVEFSNEEIASKVFAESNYIILDYITLKAEYAKPSSVNVSKNNDLTWDYTKAPLLEYIDGLPTLKSMVAVLKDSPQQLRNKNIAENDRTWELVENYDFIKPDDKSFAPVQTKTTTVNSSTRKTLLVFSTHEQFSILSVRGLNPTKSSCNRLFRLLSLYATVAKINYSRELNTAEVQISKCNNINTFAQIQHHYLSHGLNLSFQYLKGDGIIKSRLIDPFVLSDGLPSYIVYDRKIKPHSSCPPSRVLQFDGVPPTMNEQKLIALLKRTINVKNFKVKLITPKDPKKSSTISGEIWFSSVSEAIEVVMEINYAIFWNKDTNKKDYMLKLRFISEVLPLTKMVSIKTENNKMIQTEGNKVINIEGNNMFKTEGNKVINIEGNNMLKTKDDKAIKIEDNKVIKTKDDKVIKIEDNKVIKTEDYKVIKTENNKRIKTEDIKVIKIENNNRIKTEDYNVIKAEYTIDIKTEVD